MTNKPIPGSVGVMLFDTRQYPRLYRMIDTPTDPGFAVFAPMDDALNPIIAPLKDFWPLLDTF